MTTTRVLLSVLRSMLTAVLPSLPKTTYSLRVSLADGYLVLTSQVYDCALWAFHNLGAEPHDSLDVQVDGQKLADFLSTFRADEPVALTPDQSRLRVKVGGSQSTLVTVPDYAPAFSAELLATFRARTPEQGVPAALVADGLQRVLPAVAPTGAASTPALAGVRVAVDDAGLTCASTDSFRAAQATIPAPATAQLFPTVVVPLASARALVKLLPDDGTAQFDVAIQDSQPTTLYCYFRLPTGVEVVWASQLLDGPYPAIERVLGQIEKYPPAIPVDGVAMQRALKQAQAMEPGRLHFQLGADGLRLFANNAYGSTFEAELPATPGETQETMDVWFNPRFVTEGFKLAGRPGEPVQLHLLNPTRPGFLTAGTEGVRVIYAMMPLDPEKV